MTTVKTNTDKFCKQVTLMQNPFQMRLYHEPKGMIAYSEQDNEKAKEYYGQAKNFNALNDLNYAFMRNIMR